MSRVLLLHHLTLLLSPISDVRKIFEKINDIHFLSLKFQNYTSSTRLVGYRRENISPFHCLASSRRHQISSRWAFMWQLLFVHLQSLPPLPLSTIHDAQRWCDVGKALIFNQNKWGKRSDRWVGNIFSSSTLHSKYVHVNVDSATKREKRLEGRGKGETLGRK